MKQTALIYQHFNENPIFVIQMKKPPLYRTFLHALHGLFAILRSERNFQIELLALLINLFLIIFLNLSATEAALILICCFAVLSAEIFNTAIEKICDLVQPDFDDRVKFIKDISAGAVLILSFLAVLVGLLVYYHYLVNG